VIQRLSGVALLVYLFLHVLTIHKLGQGPRAFDEAMATFRHPLFKLAEIGLLGTVIAHAMNGIRITLLDLGYAHPIRRKLWAATVVVGAALFLLGAVPMFVFSVVGRPV
jgi:succinate dehydrogenase cytochrome b556 subunit